jgi:hypothetical protein
MTAADRAVASQRAYALAVSILLPFVGWQAYAVWFGGLIQSARASASSLVYFALVAALGAAWSVVDLEYFPKAGILSRRTRVWFAVAVNLWCAALILLWLEPWLAPPIVVSIFAIADVMGFQAARDLFQHARRRAGRTGAGRRP